MPMKDRDWYVDPLRDDPDKGTPSMSTQGRKTGATQQDHAAWVQETEARMARIADDARRARAQTEPLNVGWGYIALAVLLLVAIVVALLLLSGSVVIHSG